MIASTPGGSNLKKTPIERLRKEIETALEREAEIVIVSKVFEYAWRRETSRPGRHDDWTQANAAMGQSDATAVLVQAKLGGEIRKTEVPGYGPHYYNVLADGRRLGLTDKKFPTGTEIPEGQPISASDLLASEDGQDHFLTERLSYLSDRFDEVLKMLERLPGWKATKRKTPT